MKKIKFSKPKQKENNSSNTIQQLIFEDVKNINKFNIIIEEFTLALQNNDQEKVKTLYQTIKEVLEFFFINNKNKLSQELINFLQSKINLIINIIIEALDEDEDKFAVLLIKFIFENLKYTANTKEIIESLVDKFITDELYNTRIIRSLSKRFEKAESHLQIFLDSCLNKLDNESEEGVFYNIYNFIISIERLIEIENKKLYQNVVIKMINSRNFPDELMKELLLSLNKNVFDNIENPLILADYLIEIYENSKEFDIKTLSLSGLFVLITKYKLDYPSYYNILYRTIGLTTYDNTGVKTIFDTQHKARFIKILELSLKNPTVPIIVILSFIKVNHSNLEISQYSLKDIYTKYCNNPKYDSEYNQTPSQITHPTNP
jgi:hypothetical protein